MFGSGTAPLSIYLPALTMFPCLVQVWVVFYLLQMVNVNGAPMLQPVDVSLPSSSAQVRLKQCHEGRDESFDTFILHEDKVKTAMKDQDSDQDSNRLYEQRPHVEINHPGIFCTRVRLHYKYHNLNMQSAATCLRSI